jgi:hypothetical protein
MQYTLAESALCRYWLKQFGVNLFEKGAFMCLIQRFICIAWTAAIYVNFQALIGLLNDLNQFGFFSIRVVGLLIRFNTLIVHHGLWPLVFLLL